MRRVVASLAVLGAVALGATTALAAAPTGDPQAIATYRQAVAATNALRGYVQSQSGYVRIQDSLGPTRYAHWAWGWDQFQPGYHPATEHLVLAQRGGRTVWIDDTLSAAPKGCRSPRCRLAVPIEIVITRTRAYYGLISGSKSYCFTREPLSDVPYTVGYRWWTTAGQYAKARPDGPLTEITSRFTIVHQPVTESDWITTSTHLFAKSTLRFAAGGGHLAYAFHNVDVQLTAAPHLPKLTLCS